MKPHVIEAVKAGHARRMPISQNVAREIQTAISKIASALNTSANRETVLPPESKHLDGKDRSAVSQRPRDPAKVQAKIDERLEQDRVAREKNEAIGEANLLKHRYN